MVFWFEQYSSKSRDAGTAQSHLTDDQKHPLHESHSIFAGMFTEAEVLNLRELSGVSAPSLMDRSIYDALQSQLDPKALKEHYSSYLAGGRISVYNPVSIMSAFENHQIRNFWTQTGLIVCSGHYCSSSPYQFNRRVPSVTHQNIRRRFCPG